MTVRNTGPERDVRIEVPTVKNRDEKGVCRREETTGGPKRYGKNKDEGDQAVIGLSLESVHYHRKSIRTKIRACARRGGERDRCAGDERLLRAWRQ